MVEIVLGNGQIYIGGRKFRRAGVGGLIRRVVDAGDAPGERVDCTRFAIVQGW